MIFFILILIFFNSILFLNFAKVAKKINVYDFPDKKRKLHNKPIPSIGGLFILNALFVSFIYMFIYTNLLFPGIKNLISFILISLSIFALGIIDDKFSVMPNVKLCILFFMVLVFLLINENLIIRELNFSFLDKKIYLENFSILFTILCILLFINAFNMLDGINLIAGLYAFILFLYLYLSSNNEFFLFFLVSLLFFLIKNYQNKSFLGNNGSMLISFILSIFFIRSYKLSDILFSDQIFLIMSIPGFDMLRLFLIRIFNGKNPFEADRNHLHHLLMKKFNHFNTILIFLTLFLTPMFFSYYVQTFYIPIIISFFLYSVSIIFLKLSYKKNEKIN
jgi:UDP-GlcNAc:undecaprenyl-phosphate GlcNAc-1-phosphate transferase